ncbi:tail fiber domain-containing protein [Affinibrenneria salicis]|uniref:Tail fiber domain-containing protein n=1 Tax=Affinibrenneria salicis TaxID=2590031 RepID=A0A5J5FZS9_9GAMM|nr:tail fiber domain-containing protein [Affinibrenneria salicis]KAA8999848.1 tail fiber domain-containing protein [Affinibrenneria salicis]
MQISRRKILRWILPSAFLIKLSTSSKTIAAEQPNSNKIKKNQAPTPKDIKHIENIPTLNNINELDAKTIQQSFSKMYPENTIGASINLLKYALFGSQPINSNTISPWEKNEEVKFGEIRIFENQPIIHIGNKTKTKEKPDNNWRHCSSLANGYITLEQLGGRPIRGFDNSEYIDKFHSLALLGICNELRLGAGVYETKKSHIFTCPVTIRGIGSNFTQTDQYGTSAIYDKRGRKSNGYLLTFDNGKQATIGIRLDGFQVYGNRSDENQGVMIKASGWAIYVENLMIRNFGKQGLSFEHVNDGTYTGLQILACGGYIDNTPYYAIDMDPSGLTSWINLSSFTRLHVEHCRYAIKLAGWMLTFIGCHIETGNWNSTDNFSPMINIGPVARPIIFVGCHFISPDWEKYLSSTKNNSEDILSKIPGMIDTTYPKEKIWVINEYETKIKFQGCNFTVSVGRARFINLPWISIDLIDCHSTSGSMYKHLSPFTLGARSIVTGNTIIISKVSNNKSIYSNYVNDIFCSAIHQNSSYGIFHGNNIICIGYTGKSLAAITSTNPDDCIYHSNKIIGYTHEMLKTIGGQIFNGLRIRSSEKTIDIATNSLLTSSNKFCVRTNQGYQTSHLVYDASQPESFTLRPSIDNGAAYIGNSSITWTSVYVKSGVITTADERIKKDITKINDIEMKVARELKNFLSKFKYNSTSGMSNQEMNKIHFGISAQNVVNAFNKFGLNAMDYGIVVYDSWENIPPELDDEGEIITPEIKAGNKYSIRYDELFCFIISSI